MESGIWHNRDHRWDPWIQLYDSSSYVTHNGYVKVNVHGVYHHPQAGEESEESQQRMRECPCKNMFPNGSKEFPWAGTKVMIPHNLTCNVYFKTLYICIWVYKLVALSRLFSHHSQMAFLVYVQRTVHIKYLFVRESQQGLSNSRHKHTHADRFTLNGVGRGGEILGKMERSTDFHFLSVIPTLTREWTQVA